MARTESQLTSSEIAIIESLVPIGTANQQIRVDAGATGLEYFTPSSASGDMLASTYDPAGGARQVSFACTTQTAITDYTFTGSEARDSGYLVTTASNRTVNISADLFSTGYEVSICKGTNNANTVTLDAQSGNNINGSQTFVLTQYNEVVTLLKDGADTWKIKNHYYPISGTNTGDQASIVGITGTFAQFNTACTDADFARTDAANTFIGVQTMTSPVISTPTFTNGAINFNAPEGFLINGKIVPSVATNNLTVAIKTLSGGNPSSTDPVYVRIGDSIRTITGALSVTKNAGTNWCNSGATELATLEIDYFVYLGYNTTDGVVIGFSRIPYGTQYSSFSATTTNEKYCAISTITNATSTDYYSNIGRFAATLSATASFNWSVPTFTATNLIQRPIYETRVLTWAPTITGYSANPTDTNYRYRLVHSKIETIFREATSGTSNATTTTYTLPFSTRDFGFSKYIAPARIFDNGAGVTTPGMAQPDNASVNVLKFYKDWNAGVWTAALGKRIDNCQFIYEI